MPEENAQNPSMHIGKKFSTQEDIYLPVKALSKHVSVFGQSGSGKTVVCKILI